MPVSLLAAASTQQNARISPPQQLFNNLNNQAQLNNMFSPHLPHFLLTRQTYYTCLLLSLLPHPHTQCREPGALGCCQESLNENIANHKQENM